MRKHLFSAALALLVAAAPVSLGALTAPPAFASTIKYIVNNVPITTGDIQHRAAFLICDCCGAAQEFEPDFGAQVAAADHAGYAVRALTLEARGLCPACRAE